MRSSKKQTELVSIVIPVYNAEKYIAETIESVLKQTYKNWELILVDDCSSDNSIGVIKPYLSDPRIRLLKNRQNLHAALTRNKGIKSAKGRYLAFLDADDMWLPEKLEKQISFMEEQQCAFSFTSYEFADSNCIPNGKQVRVPETITYKQALRNTTIWTSTVIFDLSMLTKEVVSMPNILRGQDTATWWKVLRKTKKAYGFDNVSAYYRRQRESLSSNKITALKRTWYLYRNVEQLGLAESTSCFLFYCTRAILRRI